MTRTKLATYATWVLALFWLTMFTATHIPPTVQLEPVENNDKVFHALAYAGLAFLLVAAWEIAVGRLNGRHLVLAWFVVVAYGALDEITQIPVGRDGDYRDWIADAFGAAIGIALFVLIRRVITKRSESANELGGTP